MTIAPSSAHPTLVLHGPADADWAACLMLDLRARGVDVTGDVAGEPGALVVVRSSFAGGRRIPSAEVVRAVQARRGPYVVARHGRLPGPWCRVRAVG
jgi:hypothetical protein